MGEAQADALCAEQGGNHRERDTKPSLNLSKDRMFPNDGPFPVFIYGSITGVLALQKFTKYNHEARCRGEVLEGTVCSRTMWGRGEDSSSSRKAPCMHRPDHCGWGCLATQPIHPQRNRRRNRAGSREQRPFGERPFLPEAEPIGDASNPSAGSPVNSVRDVWF